MGSSTTEDLETSSNHTEEPPSKLTKTGKSYSNPQDLHHDEPEEQETSKDKRDGKTNLPHSNDTASRAPPLPREEPPPLPTEPAPGTEQDDGWAPLWDDNAQAFYFYNRFTQETTWTNPRVPEASVEAARGVANHDRMGSSVNPVAPGPEYRPHGGYDPAIHGDYDPTAPYAQAANVEVEPEVVKVDEGAIYTATGTFNRFTGKWQAADITPENHNDENKSRRQMSAFFDVDAAANSHNGKSLKAERSGKKLTKQEIKQFKEKRREKKEEKRRAWLRD